MATKQPKYFECVIPSLQFALPSGEIVAIANRYLKVERDDIAEEINRSHKSHFVEISEEDYENARARQALSNPQDLLREEIRQQVLAEVLAQTNQVGSVSTTAGIGQVQEGFRKPDAMASEETSGAINAAIAANKK